MIEGHTQLSCAVTAPWDWLIRSFAHNDFSGLKTWKSLLCSPTPPGLSFHRWTLENRIFSILKHLEVFLCLLNTFFPTLKLACTAFTILSEFIPVFLIFFLSHRVSVMVKWKACESSGTLQSWGHSCIRRAEDGKPSAGCWRWSNSEPSSKAMKKGQLSAQLHLRRL